MALEPGTRFGPYEVAESIGSGGMGEVYRAKDTELKRDVALKVLPPGFVEDSDRLARFQREAEILASLNHPNIAQVYGLARSDGQAAIAMELVEGPTLADRIKEGPIPPDEAMGIALQIAAALEAAHAKHIVHRDLKPANVKARDDGTVKVLDFGISKPIDPAAISGSPVMTTPAATQTGIILGTAAYMSPEQARGKFVDERTDIWAFGCLLFELLTGQPAFGGEDVMLTLARVLDRDTDLSSLPGTISVAVRHTIELCLEKDPRKRIADIRDVRLALEGAFESRPLQLLSDDSSDSSRRPWLFAVGGMLAAGIVAAMMAWSFWPAPPMSTITRFVHRLAPGVEFRSTNTPVVNVSRDGLAFVYNTLDGLRLRSMDRLETTEIPAPQVIGITNPTLSPDGAEVVYFVTYTGEMVRTSVSGGSRSVITNIGSDLPNSITWEGDGFIWFSNQDGISRVPAAGGTPELIVPARDGERLYRPQYVPDADAVIFTVLPAEGVNWDAGQIVVESLADDERTILIAGASDGRLLPTGHLAHTVGNDVFVVGLGLEDWRVNGSGVSVLQNVMRGAPSPATHYSVSDSGTLVYAIEPTGASGLSSLVWVDPQVGEVPFALPQPRNYLWPRISSGGSQVGSGIFTDGQPDQWITDLDRPVFNRITSDARLEFPPIWSQDEETVTYSVFGGGQGTIFRTHVDGTSDPEELLTIPTDFLSVEDWGCNENEVVFSYGTLQPPLNDLRIGLLDLDSTDEDGRWRPLIDRGTDASMLSISPNCEWIAYQSSASGEYRVYIERFPELGSREVVSDDEGGWAPVWSRDGQRLYYRRLGDGAMMVVDIESSPELQMSSPAVYFENNGYVPLETPLAGAGAPRQWDVGLDGRFLMKKVDTTNVSREFIVVENWFEELRRLAPTD